MRIQLVSDLHLEFDPPGRSFALQRVDRDVLLLPGDIHLGTQADRFILRELEFGDVVYLAGNHEGYRQVLPRLLWALRGPTRERINRQAAELGHRGRLFFLENSSAVIGGVRFLGGTLWSDMAQENPEVMRRATHGMNDYNRILLRKDPDFTSGKIALTPQDTVQFHKRAVAFIASALQTTHAGPTVVCTHHLPTWRSIPAAWEGHILNGAYASDLEHLMEQYEPEAWIHGHVHSSCDFHIARTRVLCNPRGYHPDWLNSDFHPGFIFEV
jgi:hypothetical protein